MSAEPVPEAAAPPAVEGTCADGWSGVRDAFAGFLVRARSGGGPMLLECLTHRLRGHYEGDPQRYRQALAAEEWQRLDPILRLQRRGIAEGWLDEGAPSRLAQQARAEIEEAVRFARESSYPPPDLASELVYA